MNQTIPLPPLTLNKYHIQLTPQAPTHLPHHLGSLLRGGLNITFKKLVCLQPHHRQCDPCPLLHTCTYPAIFQPPAPPDSQKLSNHQRIPVPYIIHPPPSQAQPWPKNHPLPYTLTLIGQASHHLPYLILALQKLSQNGLGKQRTPAHLTHIHALPPSSQIPITLWQNNTLQPNWRDHPHWTAAHLSQATNHPTSPTQLTIHLRTPTRLKYQRQILHTPPPFHVLLRTLLRRLSALSYFHNHTPWDIDYSAWIEQAKAITLHHHQTTWQSQTRYSTRQRQRIQLGGLTGTLTYQAPTPNHLTPYLPLLTLGQHLHLGKGTAFGNGHYTIHPNC